MPDTTHPLPSFRLAHTSDLHLGYEAYRATSPGGHNQRGEDLARAFIAVVDDIVEYDPPLVVIPGDLIDRPQVPIRYMLIVRKQLERLAAVRPDGTRRQVVVSSGNHDQPRNLKETCFLELFRHRPGVHIVTDRYKQVEFPDDGDSAGRDPDLADVIVHVLPHDQLKRVEWAEVRPVPGHVNILAAHGVAGGSELYVRSLGREFAIPTDVLNLEWDYGALGHWHKRTAVNDRVWYCGSPENVSFRDVRDNGDTRGYLQVEVIPGSIPDVSLRNLPLVRRMFRLPEFDAAGLDADEITAALIDRVRAADLSGAIVAQIVTGVSRDRWALVDKAAVRRAAEPAMHFELVCRPATRSSADDGRAEVPSDVGLSDVDELLDERGSELLGDEAAPAVSLARKLVGEQLDTGLNVPHASGEHDAAGPDDQNDADGAPADGAADARSPGDGEDAPNDGGLDDAA